MPQYQINGSFIVNAGQIASSNNGFDPQMRTRTKGAVGFRIRTKGAVGMRTRTRKA